MTVTMTGYRDQDQESFSVSFSFFLPCPRWMHANSLAEYLYACSSTRDRVGGSPRRWIESYRVCFVDPSIFHHDFLYLLGRVGFDSLGASQSGFYSHFAFRT